jgi:hypothetical protein
MGGGQKLQRRRRVAPQSALKDVFKSAIDKAKNSKAGDLPSLPF